MESDNNIHDVFWAVSVCCRFSCAVCVVLQEEDLEKKSEMKVDIQEGPPPSSSWSFGR